MPIPKFQNKADYVFLIFVTSFTFVTVLDFSLQINFFFINDIFLTQNLSRNMFL